MKEHFEEIGQYVNKTALPAFSKEIIEDLERDILLEEIQQAIFTLVLGKSPGPDRYTPRFYKAFQHILVPILKKTYNAISAFQIFTPQSMEAHITLIPKPEKDHTLYNNYHPISLTKKIYDYTLKLSDCHPPCLNI